MKLRKKFRRLRSAAMGDRAVILAREHIHQLGPDGRDVGPRLVGEDCHWLGCPASDGRLSKNAQDKGHGANEFVHH